MNNSLESNEERYALTPLGLLGPEACDQIILQMVKRKLNAIVFEDGELHFVKVEKGDE